MRKAAANRKLAAHRFGLAAETLAAFYLRCKGYRILAQRYRNAQGEIDLLARKGATLVAVEVKARRSLEACDYSVPPWKQARIARALEGALAGQGTLNRQIAGLAAGAHFTIRFDVIWVAPKRLPRHIIDAWRT